eukprot:15057036-Alexandrium_andersonii.AAC.1
MLGPETEAAGCSDGVLMQRARRSEPLRGDALKSRRSPGRWLQTMDDAGSGADHPNMRTIKVSRQQIWIQTESAIVADVQRGHPAVVVPAPRSYRVAREPPLRRDAHQPDGHRRVAVRFESRDMFDVAKGYASSHEEIARGYGDSGYRVAVLNMASS